MGLGLCFLSDVPGVVPLDSFGYSREATFDNYIVQIRRNNKKVFSCVPPILNESLILAQDECWQRG
jgi:hypothetical protein